MIEDWWTCPVCDNRMSVRGKRNHLYTRHGDEKEVLERQEEALFQQSEREIKEQREVHTRKSGEVDSAGSTADQAQPGGAAEEAG